MTELKTFRLQSLHEQQLEKTDFPRLLTSATGNISLTISNGEGIGIAIILILTIITFGWSYMLCPAKDLYTYFHSYVMFLETFFYLLHIFVNELVYHYITLLINQRNSNF